MTENPDASRSSRARAFTRRIACVVLAVWVACAGLGVAGGCGHHEQGDALADADATPVPPSDAGSEIRRATCEGGRPPPTFCTVVGVPCGSRGFCCIEPDTSRYCNFSGIPNPEPQPRCLRETGKGCLDRAECRQSFNGVGGPGIDPSAVCCGRASERETTCQTVCTEEQVQWCSTDTECQPPLACLPRGGRWACQECP